MVCCVRPTTGTVTSPLQFVDIFFITDLVLNFFTAYYEEFAGQTGRREGRPQKIAMNYLRGWFFIDFLSCLPYVYVGYIIEALTADIRTSCDVDTPCSTGHICVYDSGKGLCEEVAALTAGAGPHPPPPPPAPPPAGSARLCTQLFLPTQPCGEVL